MGKTTWTRRMLASLHRAVIMDTQAEYVEFREESEIDQLLLAMEQPVFRIRHQNPENFKWLCLGARSAGRCWLVIEEAQLIIPAGKDPMREFLEIIYRGRHQNVSVLQVAQRPTTVHIAARSQRNHLITFKQVERADVQWLESVATFPHSVSDLERGEYFHVHNGAVSKHLLTLPPINDTIGGIGGSHVKSRPTSSRSTNDRRTGRSDYRERFRPAPTTEVTGEEKS